MDTLTGRHTFGFPPDYHLNCTGLLIKDLQSERYTSYRFHTSSVCVAFGNAASKPDTVIVEIAVFVNEETDRLFVVQASNQAQLHVQQCRMCVRARKKRRYKSMSWRQKAVCQELPIEWFIPPTGDYKKGRAYCRTCPVRKECLAYALEGGEDKGLWGGLSPSQRVALKGTLRQEEETC